MTGRQRSGRPTMVDVARAAGVAVSTVSRFVNDDATVGADIAGRVGAAISELGWEADDRARHLRLGVSGTIGAAVDALDSPFLREAERAARAIGLMVLATSTRNDERLEAEAVRSLVRRRVDGLIIEKRMGDADAYLTEQIAHGLPVVGIDQPVGGVRADSAVSDNATGIVLAYDHLVARGHERIVYVGDDERVFSGRQRAASFRRRAAGHQPHPARLIFTGPVTRDRVGADLDRALRWRRPPTAVVTGNTESTLQAFGHLGIGLAGLELVAFDDLELAEIVEPAVTAVAQDYAAVGRSAVEMITSRIADPGLPVRQRVLPVTLVDRTAGGRRAAAPARRRPAAG